MYRYRLTPKAADKLKSIARKNPRSAKMILNKILWLVEHAQDIAHRPIKGSPFFSLHSGSFGIPFLPDLELIAFIIDDIAQHDPTYDRINRLE
jgi:mRNA-degrading endonuclease RelE of RelBE toxin-antitoxin system